jgi:hypothetical protein
MMDNMMDGMGSMMSWMMGIGLLGWVLVIALLVTIVVLLARLLSQDKSKGGPSGASQSSPGGAHR